MLLLKVAAATLCCTCMPYAELLLLLLLQACLPSPAVSTSVCVQQEHPLLLLLQQLPVAVLHRQAVLLCLL
jgi:hypothetical protein